MVERREGAPGVVLGNGLVGNRAEYVLLFDVLHRLEILTRYRSGCWIARFLVSR